MRITLPLLAIVVALPAYAQTTTSTPTPSAPTRTHMTLQQRFERANVTHDGHLTLDQAKSGYKSLVRHFSDIDQDKKGYVTEDDIRAYYKTQRALHHQPASNHTPNS